MAHEKHWRFTRETCDPSHRHNSAISDDLRHQVREQLIVTQKQYESLIVAGQAHCWRGIATQLERLAPRRLAINEVSDTAHPIWDLQQGAERTQDRAIAVVGRIALGQGSRRAQVSQARAQWVHKSIRGGLVALLDGTHVVSPSGTVRNIVPDNLLINDGRTTITGALESGLELDAMCRQIVEAGAVEAPDSANYLEQHFIGDGNSLLADLRASHELLTKPGIQSLIQTENPHARQIDHIVR